MGFLETKVEFIVGAFAEPVQNQIKGSSFLLVVAVAARLGIIRAFGRPLEFEVTALIVQPLEQIDP